MRRRGPPPALNPTLLEGGPRDLVSEFAKNQGLARADALVELKKAGQRWKASEQALRAELSAGPASDLGDEATDPQAASSTTTVEMQQRPETPVDAESDAVMWIEWLGGLLSCCCQREGH